jgi:hypothetical protein
MPASYPLSVRPFTTKVNVLDIVDAADPNSLQEEVVAIETTLGVNPALSTTPVSSNSFANSTQFTTLVQRLTNIETGIVADTHTQYIKRTGNEVITNATASNVAFTVRGATSQSANLQNWRNAGNTVVASVSATGVVSAPNGLVAAEIDQLAILSIFGR